jgi:hypothetical protein
VCSRSLAIKADAKKYYAYEVMKTGREKQKVAAHTGISKCVHCCDLKLIEPLNALESDVALKILTLDEAVTALRTHANDQPEVGRCC